MLSDKRVADLPVVPVETVFTGNELVTLVIGGVPMKMTLTQLKDALDGLGV